MPSYLQVEVELQPEQALKPRHCVNWRRQVVNIITWRKPPKRC